MRRIFSEDATKIISDMNAASESAISRDDNRYAPTQEEWKRGKDSRSRIEEGALQSIDLLSWLERSLDSFTDLVQLKLTVML
jgi:hypothetical protein